MNSKSKTAFFLILILLFSITLLAIPPDDDEDDDEDVRSPITKFITKNRVNAAYIMFGGHSLALNKLNNYLSDADHPTVKSSYLTYGIGGHAIHNKIVAYFEAIRFIEREASRNKDFNTSIGGKYTTLNFGYLLCSKKGLMYYPYMGLGVGQLKFRITENNIHSFKDITKYQKGSTARRTAFLLNLGFSLDYFHKYKKKRKGRNNLVFGVRMGYLFSPIKKQWKVDHVHVPDGPNTALNGPYFRVIIGLGGWIRTLIKQAI